ncbi:hypothetical protein MYXA107069_37070 [Myxococcus xanthus]|nr:hypothetical protein MyxoNM_09325 [Myxococcus xanthus]SDY35219.1 hypothetical protein SAMN05444383_1497 [Myxococcus xanthus]
MLNRAAGRFRRRRRIATSPPALKQSYVPLPSAHVARMPAMRLQTIGESETLTIFTGNHAHALKGRDEQAQEATQIRWHADSRGGTCPSRKPPLPWRGRRMPTVGIPRESMRGGVQPMTPVCPRPMEVSRRAGSLWRDRRMSTARARSTFATQRRSPRNSSMPQGIVLVAADALSRRHVLRSDQAAGIARHPQSHPRGPATFLDAGAARSATASPPSEAQDEPPSSWRCEPPRRAPRTTPS